MTNPTTEWVVVRDNIAVIASEIGDVWFLELDEREALSPFSKQMTCKGTVKSTAALINGAIALGFGLTQESATDDTVSLPQYVFNLVGTYHNARRTPRNYRRAANRLKELGRQDIASYLETHALTAAMTAILRRDVRESDEAIMAQLEAAAGQKLNLAA
jgi:hypothetical protein